MVVLETQHSVLNKLIEKKLSLEELEDILFNLGYDLDNVDGDELKIDITAERLDLLSTQGLVRLIRAYLGKKNKKYEVKKSKEEFKVVGEIKEWPYAIACIVKDLNFNDEKIKEVIRIQEKLGDTLLRKRKKGGIGLYPLNKIKFPITFTFDDPKKIKFRPLEYPEELNGLEILEKHPTGIKYKHVTESKDFGTWKKFPFFKDANGIIMSMPPIINSHNVGKIDENTKDVFVEITGNDLKSIKLAFNILVGALIDMGGKCFSLNAKYSDGKIITGPDFRQEKRELEIKKVNDLLGLKLNSKNIKKLLENMDYEITKENKDKLEIIVPVNRADIWHDVDVIDDIARAYGFNNFESKMKNVEGIGETTKEVKIKDEISKILIGLGYQEAFTLMLTNKNDQFEKMNIKEFEHIDLGKSVESSINMIRCWLLPELMKVLHYNRSVEHPHKIFEINHITLPDDKKDVKAKDVLRLCVLSCHSNANFTEIKQILDYLMQNFNFEYSVMEVEHKSFIHGRVGRVVVNKKNVAFIGEIHPKVLEKWGLEMPVAAMELNLSELFDLE